MCRFIVYKGTEPIQLSHLVTRPRHSIINQAFESKLRLPSSRPMNADGFGLGWYDAAPSTAPVIRPTTDRPPTPRQRSRGVVLPISSTSASSSSSPTSSPGPHSDSPAPARAPDQVRAPGEADADVPLACRNGGHGPTEIIAAPSPQAADADKRDDEHARARSAELVRARELEREVQNERPCVFKSETPAWSNANLTRLAEKIRSPLVFAHVRASTSPGTPNEDNCHPWIFDRLMWMHNGEVSQFAKIKRALQAALPDDLFLYPSGYTDSEWAFMLFLSKLRDPHARSFTHVELRDAMLQTIQHINALCKDAGVTSPSLLNFVVSDGATVIATRYISSRTSEASSLFFSSGTSFDEYQDGGLYRMTKADKRERLILVASEPLTFEPRDWIEVRTNTMVVITPKMNILQVPIIDEFWVPPQDPASHSRSTDFAIEMGFGHGFAWHQGIEA
ncbi:glutamine amidotransferase subunit [Cryptotrichosporon argae]